MQLDVTVLSVINNLASYDQLTKWIAIFCSTYLPFLLVGILLIMLSVSKKYSLREKVVFALSAATGALLARGIASLIRFFFPRVRPYLAHAVHQLIFFKTDTPSFPSGHATFFLGLASVVYLFNRKWGVWTYVAAVIICIGRVAVGVHYPTDVLGGAAIGIVCGYFTYHFLVPIYRRHILRT